MSRNHHDVLAQLFPVELGPAHDADLAIEGAALDSVGESAALLLANAFGDTSWETVPRWERTLGLVPPDETNMAARIAAIVAKIRALGGLSRAYFIELADSLGYTIEIVEPQPFMAGIGAAYDRLYVEHIIFCWRVDVEGADPPTHPFYAGQGAAGDRLLAFNVLELIPVFQALAPAHTLVYFAEPE